MKRFFISMLLLLICSISEAQYISNFKMNADGTFTTQDGKNYDIAIMEGKSASELYDLINKHVLLAFRSAKDVQSNINDKIISIFGYAPNCTYFTAPGMKFWLSFNFNLRFQFKDGKIRIEAPTLCEMRGSAWPTLEKTFRAKGIYNKDGVLNKKESKRVTVSLLEEYFNKLIDDIINGNERSNDDW